MSTFAGNGITGYADGEASQAMFSWPSGIALDGDNNLFVAEQGNHKIWKITKQGIDRCLHLQMVRS